MHFTVKLSGDPTDSCERHTRSLTFSCHRPDRQMQFPISPRMAHECRVREVGWGRFVSPPFAFLSLSRSNFHLIRIPAPVRQRPSCQSLHWPRRAAPIAGRKLSLGNQQRVMRICIGSSARFSAMYLLSTMGLWAVVGYRGVGFCQIVPPQIFETFDVPSW